MAAVGPAFPHPPASCLNANLLDPKEQRRYTAPYILPVGISSSVSYPCQRNSQRNLAFMIKMPRDYVVWSLFNFVFLNCCCLGFLALFYSIRSRDHKIIGDVEKANHYGRKAKSMNTAALIMSIFFIIFTITFIIAMLASRIKWLNPMMLQLFRNVTKEAERIPSDSTHN